MHHYGSVTTQPVNFSTGFHFKQTLLWWIVWRLKNIILLYIYKVMTQSTWNDRSAQESRPDQTLHCLHLSETRSDCIVCHYACINRRPRSDFMLASIRDPDQICTVSHYACICKRPRSDLHCLPLCLHLSETQIRSALFATMLTSIRDPDQTALFAIMLAFIRDPDQTLHCLPLYLHLSETQIRLWCLHLSETQIRLYTVCHYVCIYQRPRSDSALFAIIIASIGHHCTVKPHCWDNTRFNHGFEVFNVCWGLRSILMPDAWRRALILTKGRNKH